MSSQTHQQVDSKGTKNVEENEKENNLMFTYENIKISLRNPAE